MTPQEITSKKRIIYLLIALGFVGLIGAHEITPADENADLRFRFCSPQPAPYLSLAQACWRGG